MNDIEKIVLLALKGIKRVLEAQGADALPSPTSGICQNVECAILDSQVGNLERKSGGLASRIKVFDVLYPLFSSWGEFSGDIYYPISCGDYDSWPEDDSGLRREYLWERGEYAAARRRLLDHCIQELEARE